MESAAREASKIMDEAQADAFLTEEYKRRRTQQHGSGHATPVGKYFPPIRPLQCYDGFRFSLQAGENHYCSPRSWDPHVWTEWELGYPSAPEPRLAPWAEDASSLTDTVYARVPSSVIAEIIEAHGGLMGRDPLEELRSKVSER